MLNFIVFLLIFNQISCSRAPDEAPDMRDDFCSDGKRTKTTGECICLTGMCVGSKCVHAGIVYYPHDCHDCKCVAKTEADLEDNKSKDIHESAAMKAAKQVPMMHDLKGDEDNKDKEEEESWEEYIDDMIRYSGATIITFVFFLFIYIHVGGASIFGGKGSNNELSNDEDKAS